MMHSFFNLLEVFSSVTNLQVLLATFAPTRNIKQSSFFSSAPCLLVSYRSSFKAHRFLDFPFNCVEL